MNRRALTIGVAVAVVTTLVAYGGAALVRVRALQGEISALERDVSGLRDQARRLTETADCLRTDPACIEKLAREEHGLVRDGETVLKFPSSRSK